MGPTEVLLTMSGKIRTVAGASAAGLHLATVDQAEIRGLVTTGHSVRRGAASGLYVESYPYCLWVSHSLVSKILLTVAR